VIFIKNKKLNNFVICPICNKSLGRITKYHLIKHNISFSNFKKLYPNFNCNNDLHRYKNSLLHKNKQVSFETRQKISKAHKGLIPWNKGLTKDVDDRIKSFWEGKKHSEETKQKISKAHKGKKIPKHIIYKIIESRKNYKHSEETKRKIGLGNKGKKRSEEHIKNLSHSLKGRKSPMKGKKLSEETKKKMSNSLKGRMSWNKGKKLSEEHKKKLSLSHKGKKISEEHKKKLSLAHKGIKNSKEHNENIKKANLGKTYSEEFKYKLSIIHTNRIMNNKKDYHKKYKYNYNYFRSSWETKVAKYLDKHNIKWEYETNNCIFKLKNGRYYIVDFYLPELNKYIEVKGYWDENSLNKCKDFINKKGIDSLIIIDEANIKNINLNILFFEYTNEFINGVECQIEESKDMR
jgi:hypothetical protein